MFRCSPEVLQYGTYSAASDVYAFGVTLWELFTYGMFCTMSSDQWNVYRHDSLVFNHECRSYGQSVGGFVELHFHSLTFEGQLLPHVESIPKQCYSVLVKCWNRNHLLYWMNWFYWFCFVEKPEYRPTMNEVYDFFHDWSRNPQLGVAESTIVRKDSTEIAEELYHNV